MPKTVLVVDDEKNIVDILEFNLTREGYDVARAYDGAEGYRMATEDKPDLVLLDVMLPGIDGLEVLKRLRGGGVTTPVIMLTAREEETDKVVGLELGADDYITKPFSVRELLARVKANIRRTDMAAETSGPEEVIELNGLRVDSERYNAVKNGAEIELSQREYELLRFLMRAPGRVFTREELMRDVWNYDYFGDVRTVDVAIRRLREKIEDVPAEPGYVKTKRGAGYYFEG